MAGLARPQADFVTKALLGYIGAMDRLETYLPRLYRYGFSLARDEDLAKDLVQQCALKALEAKTVPVDDSAYRAWLFVILRNAFFDHLRRAKTAHGLFDSESESTPEMEYWGGEERLINQLNIKQAVSRLKPHHQEIIGLIDLAGLSYAEAAKVLDIPAGTVMSRISRARQGLLTLISEGNVETLNPRRRQHR